MCVHDRLTLLYHRNHQNIVNQLYFNEIFKKKLDNLHIGDQK